MANLFKIIFESYLQNYNHFYGHLFLFFQCPLYFLPLTIRNGQKIKQYVSIA